MLIGLLALLAATPAPMAILVSTAKGDVRLPVRVDPLGGPSVAAPALLLALGGKSTIDGSWARVEIAHQPIRFLLGAPCYALGANPRPMVGAATVRRDTLYLPLQFITGVLPTELKTVFRYEAESARLTELIRRPELEL